MNKARAFVAGVGAAYFLDPASGKRRRHVLRDRGTRMVRRSARLTGKRTRFALGRLRGVGASVRRTFVPRDVALDDRTVEQRIRSDAFRDAGVKGRDVEVRVERGVATLRGAVGRPSMADDLIARVRKVPGVVEVAAMLRVGGEQAAD